MTIINYHNPYVFYFCSIIWMHIQVIVQIQKFNFNSDAFFWNTCYVILANIKKIRKLFHLDIFCSILFSILTLTLIKKEAFASNFAEDSRTLNSAAYKTYTFKRLIYIRHGIHANSMLY